MEHKNSIQHARLHMTNPEDEHNLFLALLAYAEGHPVAVLSKEGGLLHGVQTCHAIVDTGVGMEVFTARDIPQKDFEDSDWPEMLQAAYENLMKGVKLADGYVAWVKQNVSRFDV